MRNRNLNNLDIVRAVRFAAERHRGQTRSGESDEAYLEHVLEVAELTAEASDGNERLIIAAILHDVLEDTETTYHEIAQRFGSKVADIVRELTDDPTLSKRQQKEAQLTSMPSKSREARLIKMADKLSNTRRLHTHPPEWRAESIARYAKGNNSVIEAGRGTSPYLEGLWDAMWPELCEALGIE
jgi:(p)ppGpp synthase/HD superfamily hydrolase